MSELLPTLEGHWLACMASLGGGGRVTRIPGGLVLTNPRVTGTFLNALLLRGTSPGMLPATLEMGRAILSGEERQAALFLSPLSGPVEALEQLLPEYGWRRHVTQSVLARPLPLPERETSELEVTAIGPDQLGEWGRTLIAAYEVEAEAGEEIRRAWTALSEAPGEGAWVRYYLARTHGVVAGTGLTWGRGEVAGLYCGAVLPAYRRQGVERATVVRRLIDAAEAGATMAVVQTESGSPVEHLCVNRLGFRVAYERSVWLLRDTLEVCG